MKKKKKIKKFLIESKNDIEFIKKKQEIFLIKFYYLFIFINIVFIPLTLNTITS